MKSMRRGVFQITDASIGYAVGIISLVFAIGIITYAVSDNSYSIAANHAQTVSSAADKYISDNFENIISQAAPNKPFTFTAETLISAGYLPPSFTPTNNFSQSYQAFVLEPSARKLHTLILTTGGTTLSSGQANKIGLRIGANGGYVEDGMAFGALGGWKESLSVFGANPGNGHVAIAQFFNNGVAGNDFLYRKAVAGHPELNAMSTDLSLGGNDINETRNVNASATVTAGVLKSNSETYTAGWFRTTGNGGWYSEKWGGGWNMTDSTWIRAYNGKSIYTSGNIRADGTVTADTVQAKNVNATSITGNEITGNNIRSNGRLQVGEFVQLEGVATVGAACSPNGLVGRDAAGAILSCQSGMW
ncbi:shufflon system plasmid conjugative transfer pilus tip adhesin PilV, partial [Cronobacter sakazakii]